MNISIFGLGYVGCVCAGCLATRENHVIGIDINPHKINLIRSGKPTIIENNLDPFIASAVNRGLLKATSDVGEAVSLSELGMICVGSPNLQSGHLDMRQIHSVAMDIGIALRTKKEFFTIAIRSTVVPGTNKIISDIIADSSGKIPNRDFAVVSNPEFLREGNAVDDFFNPPYTVIGSESDVGILKLKELFSFLSVPFFIVDIRVAEMIKFLNNSYHALKVTFANEVGRICKSLEVNSWDLMELFIQDTQLNVSPKYFMPGAPYGGSCLPKDLKALNTIAHDQYLSLPILESINFSNHIHSEYILQKIFSKGVKSVSVFGLSFKENTDDIRYSPSLEICERLIGKGNRVTIFDEYIALSRLVGKNKYFLMEHLPHIDKLLSDDILNFLGKAELLVIFHKNPLLIKYRNLIKDSTFVLDLVNMEELKSLKGYEGICW